MFWNFHTCLFIGLQKYWFWWLSCQYTVWATEHDFLHRKILPTFLNFLFLSPAMLTCNDSRLLYLVIIIAVYKFKDRIFFCIHNVYEILVVPELYMFKSHGPGHFWWQVDSAANVQPEKVEDIWNLRGILNTSWHRVQVRVGHSNL